ncbi:hypothetical protein F3K43_27105 [Streptomyces sp. LBUM 1476]|nr:hypothetical protein [Streptomyces sp. LBUM 1476]
MDTAGLRGGGHRGAPAGHVVLRGHGRASPRTRSAVRRRPSLPRPVRWGPPDRHQQRRLTPPQATPATRDGPARVRQVRAALEGRTGAEVGAGSRLHLGCCGRGRAVAVCRKRSYYGGGETGHRSTRRAERRAAAPLGPGPPLCPPREPAGLPGASPVSGPPV